MLNIIMIRQIIRPIYNANISIYKTIPNAVYLTSPINHQKGCVGYRLPLAKVQPPEW